MNLQKTPNWKSRAKSLLPVQIRKVLLLAYRPADTFAIFRFMIRPTHAAGLGAKVRLVNQILRASVSIDSPHTNTEILTFIQTILDLPADDAGVLVEAGCFKGSSTAKFSLAAALVNKELVVFDSFAGIPSNQESHNTDIFGRPAGFRQGDFCGSLDEVTSNVREFGAIDSCRFVKGYFDETMPLFDEIMSAAYIDVDLVSSTKTCLKHLYPLLGRGGKIFSQDGHLPLVIEALNDENFWSSELQVTRPRMEGIGHKKLIQIVKD